MYGSMKDIGININFAVKFSMPVEGNMNEVEYVEVQSASMKT